ncbi:MAG TPA: hypothetical protein DCS07_08835 [Bdellovibrionales bacterium]|nr:MAG: hypothetical protein A2Z97_11590 [Bdellovibrionales bacterium GWB1_52_6]OFZ03911.1 MAG: hypothetical protein A2X97_16075 [Bdellovibrionales bacterium GWA1_52_35]OFZ37405.1 MAG: hypothetical protein A2070_12180 [Bdellovibrionales bacterium GWC1_52_8]HAR42715.1 hypothetical protein [Bdellovibrionales bacterium]HCM39649.1 hypothetical protein [Bdellovibrionales bacterium]
MKALLDSSDKQHLALPSLKAKLLQSFSFLVILYAVLGLILVAAVIMASRNTPKVIHLNYDSIAAIGRMQEALSALRDPGEYFWQPKEYWLSQFEQNLLFEESNLTEPGEQEIAQKIRHLWNQHKDRIQELNVDTLVQLRALLKSVIVANEKGMFTIAEDNSRLARTVLLGAVLYFLISLALSLLAANKLTERLASPLNEIASTLHEKPAVGKPLSLPEPTSKELLILTRELSRLWHRVGEMEKLNIQELIQEKSKLETVLESVEDALFVLDPLGRITHSNRTLLRLLNLDGKDIRGEHWSTLSTESDAFATLNAVVGQQLPDRYESELKLEQPKRFFSLRLRQITNHESKPVASLYLLHDVTERRQREKLRSELIDLLSHELKTPLQSLGTASELLMDHKAALSTDLQFCVETIAEDIDRIRAVANEFVQITQTKAKVMRLVLEKVAINRAIETWLKPFHVVAKDKGVRIEFESEGSELIFANIDSVKFPWVISNVVSNAIRFSPKGEAIVVKVTDRDGAVEIKIKDHGPGVPPEQQEKIFEPFYQFDFAAGSGPRGLMGVGLTIAKEVVEAHDGRIEYHSNHPTGSVLRILLPFPGLELT